jgi:putative peptidoglycan lipid II flippase
MVLLLWRGSRELGAVAQVDARMRRRLPRILAAAAVMGVLLWLYALMAADWFATPGLKVPALLALLVLGVVSYFGTGQLIGAFRLSDFRGAVRRRSA